MTTPTKSSTVPSTQPSAVPLADKSSARKPIIIAILTIVLLVGITLSLFFLQVKTAGKAIAVGEAATVGEAGIFLTEKTIEVGQQFKVPIKANLGSDKSVSFKFKLALEDQLAYADFDNIALNKFISVNGEDVSIVKEVKCESASGNVVSCGADSKSISVEVGWLCADNTCSNALTGKDVVLGEISLISKEKGSGKLTFSEFDVYKLGTSDDLISGDGKGVEIEVTEKKVPTPNDCSKDADCAANEQCENGQCVAKEVPPPVCDKNNPSVCKNIDECKTAGLNWNADPALGEAGKCYVACPGTSVADVNKNCVAKEVPPPVCDKNNPSVCKNIDECKAAGLNWNADPALGATGCYATCPAGSTADASKNCVTPLGAAPCDKNVPASCKNADDCNRVGLLWTEATKTCLACPAGTEFNPETKACAKVVKKKIQITLEDVNKNPIAKTAKLKAKDKYTVKAVITPEKVLPKDHLVLVRISYGSLIKTTFVDRKADVTAVGEEKIEFTHDVAPDFKGDFKVDVFVWNSWPSTTDKFEALLPEGGNEKEGGSVTYTVT